MSSSEVHSVLLSVGEAMLVVPAPSLVAVVNPSSMWALPQPQQGCLGTVTTDHGTAAVIAGESLLGRQPAPLNNRCRIALLRPPGLRESFGVLVRAYPLVVSLTEAAFTPAQRPESLPEEGLLEVGMVGRRFVCLPDLPWWAHRARDLMSAHIAQARGEFDGDNAADTPAS